MKKVKFDPGYAPIVIDSFGQVGYTYYTFSAISDLKLKRLNFPHTLRKIERFLKTNIAFYLGCLMWASYIKQFNNAELEGNQLLGEECSEEEYTSEINFLIDFVSNQLPKDSKYYSNKNYEIDGKYLPILETYKQFLILNKGFVECSKVSQIVLPENLKKLNEKDLNSINEKIQQAIEAKEIEQLFEYYNLIF
ncbi:MAG: hypothetical protein IJB79_08980 [Candidatus Gastranaerophilales bacterium]|nr:hypothetical protein [Candidatus Gastranaerophilales bacterium]